MTRNLSNRLLGKSRWPVVLLGAALLTGCHGQAHGPASEAPAQPTAAQAATQYTCPMHPQIARDHPGQCPICGMDLVPKVLSNQSAQAAGGLGRVSQSPNAAVVAEVATVRPVAAGAGADTLTLPGVVEYDPRRSRVVAARFGGRIEQLAVRFNYQPVRRGQKLLELYSPELVTAEQELIYLLEHDADNTPLVSGARQKLRLLGLTDQQLRELARTRQATYRVAVFSPYDGYVVETLMAAAPPATEAGPDAAGGAMGAGAPPAPAASFAPPPLTLTEGDYVQTGQALFRVVNTDQVWGIFQPTPAELSRLQPGQPLRVVAEGTGLPPRTARLALVEPEFRAGTSTAAVRVYLPNSSGQLRRGQRLTGQVVAAADPTAGAFWLPRTAVVDLGSRQVVFVQRNGTFVPVPVQAGQRTTQKVQVLRGLSGSENVAANGQYLIDSEGFIQANAPINSPAHE